jgi:replicative DNA helicase
MPPERAKGAPPALAPERALVACVVAADHQTAGRILAAVCDDDVADHRLRAVLTLARRVVEAGAAPEPVLLLSSARAAGDVRTGQATTDLALLLADLAGAVTVVASWRFYLAAVVEDAVRRRAAEAGQRIAQAAGHDAIDVVLDLVVTEATAVHAVAARRGADQRPHTSLRVVTT